MPIIIQLHIMNGWRMIFVQTLRPWIPNPWHKAAGTIITAIIKNDRSKAPTECSKRRDPLGYILYWPNVHGLKNTKSIIIMSTKPKLINCAKRWFSNYLTSSSNCLSIHSPARIERILAAITKMIHAPKPMRKNVTMGL